MTESNNIQENGAVGSAEIDASRLAVAIDMSATAIRGMVCSFDAEGRFEKVIVCDEVANDQETTRPIRTGRIANQMVVSNNLGMLKTALENRLNKILYPSENYKDGVRPHTRVSGAYVSFGCPYESEVVEASRNMNGEEITEEMVRELEAKARMVHNTGETVVLSVTPQEFVVDDEEEAYPVGLRCDAVFRGKFLLCYANKKDIEAIQTVVTKKQGMRLLGGIRTTPEVMSDAILSEEDKRRGVALVNIGAETTAIAMYKDGVKRKVATRQYGSKVLTEEVKSMKKNMKFIDAEKLKWNYGCVKPDMVRPVRVTIPGLTGGISTKELAKVAEACYEGMFGDVANELFPSPYWNSVCGVILTGGGARIQGLVEFLEEGFGDKSVVHYYLPKKLYEESQEAYKAACNSNTASVGVSPDDFLLCYNLLQCKLERCVEIERPRQEQEKVQKKTEKKKKGLNIFDRVQNLLTEVITFNPTDTYPKE